ncbi:oxidoreductase-like domain-containing protein [Paraburkholderia aromaticivorans]|uniref:oxidoreductase-like domain-containing protein n=1 Tax=Paraburkholderia aromaticivorans TaxID=2026199 RepID=UPI0014560484|nr:oxidoreductase-like domain-containing protein [Paraburkholderia aromaticivorans]
MPRATPKDDPQPVPPVQPDLDDCCHSGCNPCVFDLYDEALERYRTALAEWQAQQAQHKTVTRQSKPRSHR